MNLAGNLNVYSDSLRFDQTVEGVDCHAAFSDIGVTRRSN